MLTVTQAAARLGISARRVRVLIVKGRIKATKVTPRMWLVAEPVKILPHLRSQSKPVSVPSGAV